LARLRRTGVVGTGYRRIHVLDHERLVAMTET